MQNLQTCKSCKRININFRRLKKILPKYYNCPIKPLGIKSSKICVVGLAPGLHGANRTGKPFHGDFSGDVLMKVLENHKLSTKHCEGDYKPIYITNCVKCYPPDNQPSLNEIKNCQSHLIKELRSLKQTKVIIALGHIAHNAILRVFSQCLTSFPFSHGSIHQIEQGKLLIDSYHCSKININSKRINVDMLSNIFKMAKEIAYKQ